MQILDNSIFVHPHSFYHTVSAFAYIYLDLHRKALALLKLGLNPTQRPGWKTYDHYSTKTLDPRYSFYLETRRNLVHFLHSDELTKYLY
mmetsp:Transcript_14183/g.19688  ORF Transcript_14183/g.19688 Transcript_14183/m.19688 type:complete len:89 (-) Transcript_14183:110-376(-)